MQFGRILDEQEAIRLLKRGDINGLEWLVMQHQVKAIRTAFLITGDIRMAEDIVQDAFLNAFQRIHQFDEHRPFAPWVMRSVVNSAVKAARRAAKHVALEPGDEFSPLETLLAVEEPSPEIALEKSEFQERVWSAMQQLSPRQRATIVQRYFLDMNEGEMANSLGIARGTVKWLLHAARKNLRALLGSERNAP